MDDVRRGLSVPGALPHQMVQDTLRALAAHHGVATLQTDSFNHMLHNALLSVLNERVRQTTVNTLGNAMMAVTYTNVHLVTPVVQEASGAERTLTPGEAILRKLPNVFRVMGTVRVERYVNADASETSVWDKYDPITGEVRTMGAGGEDEAGSARLAAGSMTAEDGVAGTGGVLAPSLAEVPLASTDNPDMPHELAEEAYTRARAVRWVLAEVHEAGSQCIMELPAQIGSKVCFTSRLPMLNPNAASYASGEFIPNGTYRMTVPQRRVQNNRALVTRIRGGGVQCQVRSVLEHRHRSTSTITVKLVPGWGTTERVRAWVELPYVRCKVPLMALFRLLGVGTAEEAANLVVSRGGARVPLDTTTAAAAAGPGPPPEFTRWVMALLRPVPVYKKRARLLSKAAAVPARGDTSAEACAAWARAPTEYSPAFPDFECMTRQQVGEWISERASLGAQYNKDAKWMSTLSTETLPQLGLGTAPRTLAAKAQLLGYMVWRAAVVARPAAGASELASRVPRATLACMWDAGADAAGSTASGGAAPEDRDALGNNYYAVVGYLMTLLIRQCFRRQIKSVAMTVRISPQAQGSARIGEALTKGTVSNNMRYAMNTGNWGERKGNATPSQQETTQQRQQGNLLSQRTHVTSMRTPLREKTKNSDARDLHPTHFGFICPAAHSEGKQCGLRVQPALGVHFTCGQDAQGLLPRVAALLARRVGGFTPVPFPAVLSGRVAAPLRPHAPTIRDVTQQHMVRCARNSRKSEFTQEQGRYQIAALEGAGATFGTATVDASEHTAVVASMKWPGSAAAAASAGLHAAMPADAARLQADLAAHAAALARLPPHSRAGVFVNGILVGHVPGGVAAADALRRARRAGLLPWDVEVGVQDGGCAVWVGAQTGEMRRPLWVCTPAARVAAVTAWRAWCRAREPPAALWTRLMGARVLDYVGPNEVPNLLVLEDPRREAWAAAAARGCCHAEVHPATILSASVGCLPFLEHNQGPRAAYYHALANSNSSERPAVLANETSLTALVHPAQRLVRTVVERGLFPSRYGAGGMLMVAVQAAGDNVEDSMVMNLEAVQGGMLAITETHTYMAEAARSNAAIRAQGGKIFGRPTAHTRAVQAATYRVLEADGLPRVGTPVAPGSAVLGVQRRTPPTAEDEGRGGEHDGSLFTSARDVACHISDVRVSPSLKVGHTLAVVQTTALRLVAVGDKVAVSPSQKGSVPVLRPASAMPCSPQVGRPHVIMNPHAIPSRMTAGKDAEGLVALAALLVGEEAPDGTPWGTRFDVAWARGVLARHGVSPCGHHTFYDAVTGKPLHMRVFAVPQFVMRLRQMAGNKINMRSTGPRNPLTGQATEGRSVGGGQRLGGMENDALASAGAAGVVQERLRDAADVQVAWVCRACGGIGVPPAPPDIAGVAVARSGRVDLDSITWTAGVGADTHARCLLCNSGAHMARVTTRRALLLLVRELEAVGVRVQFHVNGEDTDTLLSPSPSVVRAAIQQFGRAAVPGLVPAAVVATGRLRCATREPELQPRGGPRRGTRTASASRPLLSQTAVHDPAWADAALARGALDGGHVSHGPTWHEHSRDVPRALSSIGSVSAFTDDAGRQDAGTEGWYTARTHTPGGSAADTLQDLWAPVDGAGGGDAFGGAGFAQALPGPLSQPEFDFHAALYGAADAASAYNEDWDADAGSVAGSVAESVAESLAGSIGASVDEGIYEDMHSPQSPAARGDADSASEGEDAGEVDMEDWHATHAAGDAWDAADGW